MSFFCEACQATTKNGVDCVVQVAETRVKTYTNGSKGTETVRERKVCPHAAAGLPPKDCKNSH